MAYWLIKSEPSTYAWTKMLKDKKTGWDGVRNYQARNNMREMKKGDRCFFYHSNEGKEIVGVVEVSKTYHLDPTDGTGKFGMVEVRALETLKTPVTLAAIKETKSLKDMALLRQSRLSVSPVTLAESKIILKMASS